MTLFYHFDGGFRTSGPDSFKGPIGQACKGKLDKMKVVYFTNIETSLLDLDMWKDLNHE